MAQAPEVAVRKVPEQRRFEIFVGEARVGLATYRDEAGRRVFEHTETDPAHQDQGLAGELVRAALDETRAEGLRVVPQCPYVAEFIDRHPEYGDLVDA